MCFGFAGQLAQSMYLFHDTAPRTLKVMLAVQTDFTACPITPQSLNNCFPLSPRIPKLITPRAAFLSFLAAQVIAESCSVEG